MSTALNTDVLTPAGLNPASEPNREMDSPEEGARSESKASISQPGGLRMIEAKPGRRWEQCTQALLERLDEVGVSWFLPLPVLCILETGAGPL